MTTPLTKQISSLALVPSRRSCRGPPRPIKPYSATYFSGSTLEVLYDNIPAIDLPPEYQPLRGGVIVLHGDYYGMGLDTRFQELSDFAGGVSYRKDGSLFNGAARELSEESLGVFDIEGVELANNSRVAGQRNMAIFLWSYSGCFSRDELRAQFHRELQSQAKSEMCDLVWIDRDSMDRLVMGEAFEGHRMYQRVSKLLSGSALLGSSF